MRGRSVLTLEDYIVEKIQVLGELGLDVTPEQREKMKTLKSEIAIDNYAHSIIVHTEPTRFKDAYSAQYVADELGVDYKTIWNWITAGKLKATKIPVSDKSRYSRYSITRADLVDFLKTQPKFAKKTSLFIETEV